MDAVWYVSYGSNMSAERFRCYIEGGTPPSGMKRNPGARDATPPHRTAGIELSGTTYFAGDSPQWGGGVAFYDHDTPGRTAARGYLISSEQLSDVAAQEMYTLPGSVSVDAAVSLPVTHGRHAWGNGVYETLVYLGDLEGHSMLTITSPHRVDETTHTAPSAAYLATMATGLREAHGWDTTQIDEYLTDLRPSFAS